MKGDNRGAFTDLNYKNKGIYSLFSPPEVLDRDLLRSIWGDDFEDNQNEDTTDFGLDKNIKMKQ